MFKDSNDKDINLGDFICICESENPYEIIEKTSVGIFVKEEYPLSIKVLNENNSKPSNTFGFIPIYFLDKRKIKLCSKDEFPECHI
jgi:hypothetical protein